MHVQCDTLLLVDVFENFRNMCIEICEIYRARFLTAPGLASQSAFKKTIVKLDLLINTDMLLIVEKDVRCRICHAIYRFAKAKNKYMKNYDKNKE